MSVRNLMNKQKLICDDIISILLIVIIVYLATFFRLIAIMSIVVYPISTLFLYGVYKTYLGLFNNEMTLTLKLINFLLGIGFLGFSIFILNLVFSQPHIPISYIIYFLSLPLLLIGIAGSLKGFIIQVYSPLYRKWNILIGFLTLSITVLTIVFAELNFTLCLISLLILLLFNGVFRSALYLSEYGLSIRKLKNLRFVFVIMNNYQMKIPEEEEIQY
jgi:hypothetical protein